MFRSGLGTSQYGLHGFSRPSFFSSLDSELAEELRILQTVPEWLVVMRTIIIHCNLEAAARSGLFGLLGDALVLVIDAYRNRARVKALLDFAEACESLQGPPLIRNQDYELESPDDMRRRLEHHVLWCYKTDT